MGSGSGFRSLRRLRWVLSDPGEVRSLLQKVCFFFLFFLGLGLYRIGVVKGFFLRKSWKIAFRFYTHTHTHTVAGAKQFESVFFTETVRPKSAQLSIKS